MRIQRYARRGNEISDEIAFCGHGAVVVESGNWEHKSSSISDLRLNEARRSGRKKQAERTAERPGPSTVVDCRLDLDLLTCYVASLDRLRNRVTCGYVATGT